MSFFTLNITNCFQKLINARALSEKRLYLNIELKIIFENITKKIIDVFLMDVNIKKHQ